MDLSLRDKKKYRLLFACMIVRGMGISTVTVFRKTKPRLHGLMGTLSTLSYLCVLFNVSTEMDSPSQ